MIGAGPFWGRHFLCQYFRFCRVKYLNNFPRHFSCSHSELQQAPYTVVERSFTITELLMTIAIVTILTSLLVSSFSRAKSEGQRGLCLANSRTIQSLNLVGVPVIYAREYKYPYRSPWHGRLGYVEIQFQHNRSETVLFVNCFDCHDANDPFEYVHSLVTIW